MVEKINPENITTVDEPVTPVRVRAYCDCGQRGELKSTGECFGGFASSRPLWAHLCETCGAYVQLKEQYPYIAYR